MKVTALGELLIDYTSFGRSPENMELFEQNAGGAPANVLVCLAKFGIETAFIGKVGKDLQGKFLKDTLNHYGVVTDFLQEDPDFFTTLAFVSLDEDGERKFSFARQHGADIHLKKEEIPLELLKNTNVFHFGSLSLCQDPAREATYFALEQAKAAGAVISYDPNYREKLWKNVDIATEEMRKPLKFVDICKISLEECFLLTGESDPEKAARVLSEKGISLVAVTLGEKGTLLQKGEESAYISGFIPKKVVDTTGAGDSFWGGFLFQYLSLGKQLQSLTLEEAVRFCHFGNAVASLNIEKHGAMKAMPSLTQVESRINEQS